MEYYTLLDFKMEPFSSSPDPRLFYKSRQHLELLDKLEISIRLNRGLNVVLGDIGTGKTTVSRQLIHTFNNDDKIEYHLVLDPGFAKPLDFLTHIAMLMVPDKIKSGKIKSDSTLDHLKELIKIHLFNNGTTPKKTTVLLIDEGQKLCGECMEVLRELLNFETNDKKLLQIVIFAQNEFKLSLNQALNFKDRISFQYHLSALDFKASRGLIEYRLNRSFVQGRQRRFFSFAALLAVYLATQGYPRKIVMLCHQVMLALITGERDKADFFLVRRCRSQVAGFSGQNKSGLKKIWAAALVAVAAAVMLFYHNNSAPLVAQTPPQIIVKSVPSPRTGTPERCKGSRSLPPRIQTVETVNAVTPEPFPDYGSIVIPKGAALYRMINLVYGRFSPNILDGIMVENPHIGAPEKVLSGDLLTFPFSAEARVYPPGCFILMILQTPNFETVFSQAVTPAHRSHDLRIWPVKTTPNGYQFTLMVDRAFKTQTQALDFLEKMQPPIQAVPTILPTFGEHTVAQRGN